ncbi:J domain-containing protein [Haloechinothrix halophila]|uniref:J domain-containing protein n=1 Tax=Haloechinothrix halophila TaxID=1069073 RepID=UPI000410E955|nr:J domain-containing protein [Haloechinothrix halophila]
MDDTTARDILGIGPHATREEARTAYKRRAKILHPDRHAHGSQADLRAAERAMAELTDALHALRFDAAKRTSDAQQATHRVWTGDRYVDVPRDRPRRPRHRGCEVCGHTPAMWIDIRALNGLIILHRTDRYAATLCRNCGTAIWRDVQAQTLTLGWWGIPALFANLAVLVNNRGYGAALRELDPPHARAAGSPAPRSEPMPLTKPVTARVLPWLATATVVIIIVLLVAAAMQARG